MNLTHLYTTILDIFGNEEVLLKYSVPRYPVQLDIFIPRFSLAIEYTEPDTFYSIRGTPVTLVQKTNICHEMGITLLQLPTTWNKRKESRIQYNQPLLFENTYISMNTLLLS